MSDTSVRVRPQRPLLSWDIRSAPQMNVAEDQLGYKEAAANWNPFPDNLTYNKFNKIFKQNCKIICFSNLQRHAKDNAQNV